MTFSRFIGIIKQVNIQNIKWEDALPNIHNETIDLIYTDPPYEMNYKSNIAGSKEWNKTGKPSQQIIATMDNDIEGGMYNWKEFLAECYRVLKQNTYIVIHCNSKFLMKYGSVFLDSGFIYQGTIIWNKRFGVGGNIEGAMKRDWEPIVYMSKGKPTINPIKVSRKGKLEIRKRISEIQDWSFSLKKSEKIGHPTQKPVELAEQVIRLMSPENGLVLDPFAGSGTTVVACQNTGRRNISYESKIEFYQLIQNRLKTYNLLKTDI